MGSSELREDAALSRQVDELVMQLQPHPRAEAHRNAVFHHVSKLIAHVAKDSTVDEKDEVLTFRFGSVPLKTYLPHGDLDLTAFTTNDKWLQKLKEKLDAEAKSDTSTAVVAGVHSVPHDLTRPASADVVKVVKCQVDGIAVDVSANALGGLCTLCLLEKVDVLLGRGHLFKRALVRARVKVLVKAWCYFESRILSSQNGLLATYALETLVLCIINMFHSQLHTPLAVLAKFLEYFSKFDWAEHCLSIRGPLPRSNINDDAVIEPDNQDDFLLSEQVYRSDEQLRTLFEGLKDKTTSFQWKHMNICDPLDSMNNLGRSVGRGNAFRVQGAFRRGWKELDAILKPRPSSAEGSGIAPFFQYTLRTLAGHRPDVGDMCITPNFNKGSSTISSRSTDMGHSAGSTSTHSRSSEPSEGGSDVDDEGGVHRHSGNTALNTALNSLLTKHPLPPPDSVDISSGAQRAERRRRSLPAAFSSREDEEEVETGAARALNASLPLPSDGPAERTTSADGGEHSSELSEGTGAAGAEGESDGETSPRAAGWRAEATGDVLDSNLGGLMRGLHAARTAVQHFKESIEAFNVGVARAAAAAQPSAPGAGRGSVEDDAGGKKSEMDEMFPPLGRGKG